MKSGALPAVPVVRALLAFAASAAFAAPDAIRREVSRLASQGSAEEALLLVEEQAAVLPPEWKAMFDAKLELGGEVSARGYTNAASGNASAEMRGEAIFRLAQYHYAAGRYNLAIPQFRRYHAEYPRGEWADASAYWMAYACLQYVRQRAGREAYLDTANAYLDRIEERGRTGYYWPLARAARARTALLRGDTAATARLLEDARAGAPAEEKPGALLLSLQAWRNSPAAPEWEDALRWNYPLSPETRILDPAPRASDVRATAPRAQETPGHALQLGAFSQRENADRLRNELAGKRMDARIEAFEHGGNILYRVMVGNYPDAETASREGRRVLTPLGYKFRVVSP